MLAKRLQIFQLQNFYKVVAALLFSLNGKWVNLSIEMLRNQRLFFFFFFFLHCCSKILSLMTLGVLLVHAHFLTNNLNGPLNKTFGLD
jgi:hypothetical protein